MVVEAVGVQVLTVGVCYYKDRSIHLCLGWGDGLLVDAEGKP